jgi:putative tryptophan/tyrosine transport system substrate-binding protein
MGFLGVAAIGWPVTTRAEQPPIPVIGFLAGASVRTHERAVAAFRHGLQEAGYVEGQNVLIEYRWAEGRDAQLPEFAAELVRRNVAVIVATGGGLSALAAKAATPLIPIIFSVATDPVQLGLVSSLKYHGDLRPGHAHGGQASFIVA